MNKQRIGAINLATGEILPDGHLVWVPGNRQNGFQKGTWCAMALDPFLGLARGELNYTQVRVFAAMVYQLDYENFIHVDQTATAEKIGMHRVEFAKALKHLVDIDIIRKGPKSGRAITYRLNPNFAWKGSGANHKKALADDFRDRIKRAGITGVIEGGAQPAQPAEQPFR